MPSHSKSTTCPPTRPGAPATKDNSPITFNNLFGSTPGLHKETISKALVNKASPASIAIASPYTL